MIVNINGKIYSQHEAKISIFDRGFLYGDSIYEVTQTFNRTPFMLEEHLDRLWRSAQKLHLTLTYSRKQITDEILKTIDALDTDRAYIRLIITRGEGEINLDPTIAIKNNLIVIAKELPPNPTWWYEQGVSVIVADTIRTSIKSVDPSAKSGNYLNNIMAYEEAVNQKAFDAIMLNHEGLVTEATTSNIWIVQDTKILTPPLEAGLLGGTMRAKLIEIAKKHQITVFQENFNAKELRMADECFLTSTTRQIVPVTTIDGNPVGDGKPGKTTLSLLQLLRKELGIY